MKLAILALAFIGITAQAGNPIDLGITPASDSLQAKLEALLQAQFDEEERGNVDPAARLVHQAREGGYEVRGSNSVLRCREYSPTGGGFEIQIQQYGCRIETP